ncbi:MAG: translation initiation factor IF-2 subunit gamma [Candidatus Thermoplasmatota archaeon]
MKVPSQPEANIGMVGHVDHGKTTLTKALTGEWTDRHSEEIKRGVSIKLGYADTAFYKCPECKEPECYSIEKKCSNCGKKTEIIRTVSFVDAPGHETLMATMLSGAAIMDGALLLIAANEPCPQPQTKEHLMALAICGIKRIIIVQNKIDLVDENKAMENYNEIINFTKGTIAENARIVPVAAHHNVNIDVLIQEINKTIVTQPMDETKPARMYIARSFDVNLPGTRPSDLVGGVIGGTLIQGCLKVGDEIEILPGRKHEKGQRESIHTTVVSLITGGKAYKKVRPGGLIAIGTNLDPIITKSDALLGNIAGAPGSLPPVRNELTLNVNLLDKVVGVSDELKVDEIKVREPLMLNIGTATTVGIIEKIVGKECRISLKIPVCCEVGQRAAIGRKIGGKWRLIGYGVIE